MFASPPQPCPPAQSHLRAWTTACDIFLPRIASISNMSTRPRMLKRLRVQLEVRRGGPGNYDAPDQPNGVSSKFAVTAEQHRTFCRINCPPAMLLLSHCFALADLFGYQGELFSAIIVLSSAYLVRTRGSSLLEPSLCAPLHVAMTGDKPSTANAFDYLTMAVNSPLNQLPVVSRDEVALLHHLCPNKEFLASDSPLNGNMPYPAPSVGDAVPLSPPQSPYPYPYPYPSGDSKRHLESRTGLQTQTSTADLVPIQWQVSLQTRALRQATAHARVPMPGSTVGQSWDGAAVLGRSEASSFQTWVLAPTQTQTQAPFWTWSSTDNPNQIQAPLPAWVSARAQAQTLTPARGLGRGGVAAPHQGQIKIPVRLAPMPRVERPPDGIKQSSPSEQYGGNGYSGYGVEQSRLGPYRVQCAPPPLPPPPHQQLQRQQRQQHQRMFLPPISSVLQMADRRAASLRDPAQREAWPLPIPHPQASGPPISVFDNDRHRKRKAQAEDDTVERRRVRTDDRDPMRVQLARPGNESNSYITARPGYMAMSTQMIPLSRPRVTAESGTVGAPASLSASSWQALGFGLPGQPLLRVQNYQHPRPPNRHENESPPRDAVMVSAAPGVPSATRLGSMNALAPPGETAGEAATSQRSVSDSGPKSSLRMVSGTRDRQDSQEGDALEATYMDKEGIRSEQALLDRGWFRGHL